MLLSICYIKCLIVLFRRVVKGEMCRGNEGHVAQYGAERETQSEV